MEEKKRLTSVVLARIAVVTLILISSGVLRLKDYAMTEDWVFNGLNNLVIVTYFFSLGTLALLRSSERRPSPSFAYYQIVWDLLFVTLLLLFTGGVTSPYSFLYLLCIMNASVLLARRQAIYSASLCGILYGGIGDLQYYGSLSSLGLSRSIVLLYGESYFLYTIFTNICAFYLTAFLTGYLSERARKSENALQEKAINYEELERLNSSIVKEMNSGLLTLNREGRIRVFNSYLERLTGLTQHDAYNHHLQDVFPSLDRQKLAVATHRREIELMVKGEKKIIGFNISRLRDKNGKKEGVIINIHDLTAVRRMEEALKRADRLAAIGALSAKIAHEIRNPLASISGSVQMIADTEAISATDKKLLQIIQRETERLESLIQDFLAYAKPRPPMKFHVSLRVLFDDLKDLARGDSRFSSVTFRENIPKELLVFVDVDQFKQVLWNLFINSAEAMPAGGEIGIEASECAPGDAPVGTRSIRISVYDEGHGIPESELPNIFEPFFTTKSNGSGLGLATVYRIVEAHGGTVTVQTEPGRGARFFLYLEKTAGAVRSVM